MGQHGLGLPAKVHGPGTPCPAGCEGDLKAPLGIFRGWGALVSFPKPAELRVFLVLCPLLTPTSAMATFLGGCGGRGVTGSEPACFLCSRKPEELKDLAPGTNPPFLLFNKELKTDFIKIEEFLEQTLGPPM